MAVMAASIVVPVTVFADVPPEDARGCESKKAGDSCTNDHGSSASCAESTCSRINYSCDGGKAPCGSVQYACLLCTGASKGGCQTSSGSAEVPVLVCAVVLASLLLKKVGRKRAG